MVRQMIKIDEELCNGCGLCVTACHEGAIAMVEGKAKVIRDDYCDGLGDCLPVCPTGAISFEMRKALPYDAEAVKAALAKRAEDEKKKAQTSPKPRSTACEGTCPSANPTVFSGCPGSAARALKSTRTDNAQEVPALSSELRQWPVQLALVPANAPYFNGANLLIAADCAAFSHGDFHRKFMKNRVTLIGCPKLDSDDYATKLAEIIKRNDIKSIMVARMEVPCCGGLTNQVKKALLSSGKMIPWRVVTITTDGQVRED